MATEKKTKTADKTDNRKQVKTDDAIRVYNILKTLKISKLDKTGQFTIIRAARVLKPVATAFEDFVKDAQERLKPAGFDALREKTEAAGGIENLPAEEQKEAKEAAEAYNKDVSDCVEPELKKICEVDMFKGFSDDVLSKIASENSELNVEILMLIEDVCGHPKN